MVRAKQKADHEIEHLNYLLHGNRGVGFDVYADEDEDEDEYTDKDEDEDENENEDEDEDENEVNELDMYGEEEDGQGVNEKLESEVKVEASHSEHDTSPDHCSGGEDYPDDHKGEDTDRDNAEKIRRFQYLKSIDFDVSFASMLISDVKRDLFAAAYQTARGCDDNTFCQTLTHLRRYALEVSSTVNSIEFFLQHFNLLGSGSKFLQGFRIDTEVPDEGRASYESGLDQEGKGDGVRGLSQEEYEKRVRDTDFVRELLVEQFEEFQREVLGSGEIELGGWSSRCSSGERKGSWRC